MTGLSLRQATSERAICALPRDHFEIGDWAIMTDGHTVWITHQKLGGTPDKAIAVPKRIFDRLLASYEKPQKANGNTR